MSERRWRVTRPRPGWKAYERLLDDLFSRRYRELNDVEKRLRSTLVAFLKIEVRCLQCGRWFRPEKAFQDFCSKKCKDDWRYWNVRRFQNVPQDA